MSASFLLFALPDVKNKTDDRLNALSTVIANLSQDDLKTLREDCVNYFYDSDDANIRDQITQAAEEYWDLGEYSDVHGAIHLPGCKLSYIFTGGTSWGDQPTDLCDMFQLLSSCKPVFDKLKQWAEEDLIKKFLDT